MDVKTGAVSRKDGYIVIMMRYYPRFLRKELRDEFASDLAPDKLLLSDFNEAQKRLGNHNASFAEVDYEQRFQLDDAACRHLKALSDLSCKQDVYLLCICKLGERCHREILMLAAHKLFKCQIGEVFHEYPIFMNRLNG